MCLSGWVSLCAENSNEDDFFQAVGFLVVALLMNKPCCASLVLDHLDDFSLPVYGVQIVIHSLYTVGSAMAQWAGSSSI